ncbi:MAG: hypothetical protein AB7U45_14240 [Desulfamplus sp.]
MKKKPSLLDIELFVQKRADEKKRELSQIEADSAAMAIEKEADAYNPAASNLPSSNIEQDGKITDNQMQTPLVIEEMFTSIIGVTDTQRDDINKLKQDIFKLKEELRVYHSFLSSQQKKIAELEKSLSEKSVSSDDQKVNMGIIDANYSKLLLKNIIWLKEEKDFSSNDVARLFRAEAFQTPYPHTSWNEKVINILYNEAKKSFL